MKKKPGRGTWYWLTISNPAYYFVARAQGKDEEKEASAAIKALGSIVPAIVVIVIVGIILLIVLTSLGII